MDFRFGVSSFAVCLLYACGQSFDLDDTPETLAETATAESLSEVPALKEAVAVPQEIGMPSEVATSEPEVSDPSVLTVPPRMLELPELYMFHDRAYNGTLAIRNGCLVFTDVGTKNGGVVLPDFDAAKVEWDGERLITRNNTYSIGDRVRFGGNMGMGSWEHKTCGTVTSATVRLK